MRIKHNRDKGREEKRVKRIKEKQDKGREQTGRMGKVKIGNKKRTKK